MIHILNTCTSLTSILYYMCTGRGALCNSVQTKCFVCFVSLRPRSCRASQNSYLFYFGKPSRGSLQVIIEYIHCSFCRQYPTLVLLKMISGRGRMAVDIIMFMSKSSQNNVQDVGLIWVLLASPVDAIHTALRRRPRHVQRMSSNKKKKAFRTCALNFRISR